MVRIMNRPPWTLTLIKVGGSAITPQYIKTMGSYIAKANSKATWDNFQRVYPCIYCLFFIYSNPSATTKKKYNITLKADLKKKFIYINLFKLSYLI